MGTMFRKVYDRRYIHRSVLFGLFIFKADPADPQSTDWKIRSRRTAPKPQPEPAAVFAAEETAAAGDVAAEMF